MFYGYIAKQKGDSVSILNTSRWNEILKNQLNDDKGDDKGINKVK